MTTPSVLLLSNKPVGHSARQTYAGMSEQSTRKKASSQKKHAASNGTARSRETPGI